MSGKIVKIAYTNWRGELEIRRIIPESAEFKSNQWHPEPQWMWNATDVDKGGDMRTFAMANIHRWEPER
jgi:hypothetical protein